MFLNAGDEEKQLSGPYNATISESFQVPLLLFIFYGTQSLLGM
jgi:hypothetical protein